MKKCATVLGFVAFGFLLLPPAYATSACPMTPENPSLVLFLAGSAVFGYKYLRARF